MVPSRTRSSNRGPWKKEDDGAVLAPGRTPGLGRTRPPINRSPQPSTESGQTHYLVRSTLSSQATAPKPVEIGGASAKPPHVMPTGPPTRRPGNGEPDPKTVG